MIDNYIREVIGGIGARSKKEQLLRFLQCFGIGLAISIEMGSNLIK